MGRHDLGVGARNVDASVEAGLVVGLDNVSAEDLAGTDTAVVGTLRSREPVLGPAVRPAGRVEESVLLLETEPELVLLVLLHEKRGGMTEVELVRLAIAHPRLAHDKDVGPAAERVVVDGDGAEVDVGVVTRSLASRRAVKVPFWEILNLDLGVDDSLARVVGSRLGLEGL